MFYVNDDEPESKFLYTETIKLYCIVLTIPQVFIPRSGEWLCGYHSNPPPTLATPPPHPAAPGSGECVCSYHSSLPWVRLVSRSADMRMRLG